VEDRTSVTVGAGPAPGQNGGSDDLKPAEQLCRIAGCSFKAVPELDAWLLS